MTKITMNLSLDNVEPTSTPIPTGSGESSVYSMERCIWTQESPTNMDDKSIESMQQLFHVENLLEQYLLPFFWKAAQITMMFLIS